MEEGRKLKMRRGKKSSLKEKIQIREDLEEESEKNAFILPPVHVLPHADSLSPTELCPCHVTPHGFSKVA